jgi:hypothetical protein
MAVVIAVAQLAAIVLMTSEGRVQPAPDSETVCERFFAWRRRSRNHLGKEVLGTKGFVK